MLLVLMITACASVKERHLPGDFLIQGERSATVSMDGLLADCARFAKGDEKTRNTMLDEARRAHELNPADGDKALRHAVLLSLVQPRKALGVLQKLPQERLDEAQAGLRILLLRQLQQRQGLYTDNQTLKRELLAREKTIAKLRGQIEALKLIDRTLFEQEDSLMLDGR